MASKNNTSNFILHRLQFFAVFIAYLGLSVGLTWPLILNLRNSILGDFGDSRGAIWWMWAKTNGYMDSGLNSLISAPFGVQTDIGFSQPILEWTLVGLTRAFGEILGYNLFVLFSFPLTALSTYLFLNFLLKDKVASFFGGFIFGFCPAVIMHVMGGHQAFAFNMFLPLFLLALFINQRERTVKSSLYVALSFSAVSFTALYMGYFCCYIGLFFFLLDVRGFDFGSGSGLIAKFPKRLIKNYLLILVFSIAIITPFVYRAILGQLTSGEISLKHAGQFRDLNDLMTYSSRIWDFLIPSAEHPFVGRFFAHFVKTHLHGSNLPEQTLYVGFFSILFSFLGVHFCLKKSMSEIKVRLFRFFFWGSVFMFVLSLPPLLAFGNLKLPTLSFFAHSFAPMFRAYGRAGIPMMLFIAGMASISLSVLRDRLGPAAFKPLSAFLFLFLAFEFWSISPNSISEVSKPPEIYDWLAKQDGNFAIAIYPMTESSEFSFFSYLFWQRIHGKRMVNGAQRNDKSSWSFFEQVRKLNDDFGCARLKASGVKYIIVHEGGYSEGMIPRQIKRFYEKEIALVNYNQGAVPPIPSGLKLVRSFGDDKLYSFSGK